MRRNRREFATESNPKISRSQPRTRAGRADADGGLCRPLELKKSKRDGREDDMEAVALAVSVVRATEDRVNVPIVVRRFVAPAAPASVTTRAPQKLRRMGVP
jgi:hypothetical protein